MKTVDKSTTKQKTAGRVMTGVLLVVIGAIVWFAIPRKHAPAGSLQYYSDDDGTTWFADEVSKPAPFQHNGKEAVIAKVYETSGGKQFVAYLEKYTDEQNAKLAEKGHGPPPHSGPVVVKVTKKSSGLLVKKPHEGTWVPAEDPTAKQIETVTAPDGSADCTPSVPE